MQTAFGRGQRGTPAMTGSGEFKIHQVPSQMGEMGITDHRRNFEARIMSAFKVHPLVIGLDSGMQYSAYNNLEVAERASWSKGVLPVMGMISRAYTQQLLWLDFNENKKRWIEFDRSEIEALREDQRTKIEKERIWNERLTAPAVTLKEWREEHGLPTSEEEDVYFFPDGYIPIKKSDIGNAELIKKLRESAAPKPSGNGSGKPDENDKNPRNQRNSKTGRRNGASSSNSEDRSESKLENPIGYGDYR